MNRMKDKVVIVSGGARGVGAADVRRLSEEGAAVAIADVLEEEGTALAHELQAQHADVRYFSLDVTNEDAWRQLVADVLDWKGRITTLVNNAGIVNRTGITGTSLENWQRVMSVNLNGAFLGMKTVCPAIRDAGGGAVVNMASVAAHVGHNDPAYAASKAGLLGLTRTAAAEYVEWNIRVNAICPGIIVTGLNAGGSHLEPWRSATPLGRFGTMEEAANLVLFLASDEAGYITGEDIAMDGGFLAAGSARRISLEAGIDLTAGVQT
ncbi:3alpha(or 20beta)-hydroxysteroid dehydrogenase [Rhizobium petrolearium]|uniref:SDR family NAD(P)-dependent oxidoreductase n=2 Tax=Neorhizobium TaxID=1525371 RepID=A0ABV0MCT5_9HYPH|nr:SDR family NAD(P)-dependent oxidoreductase [Neorhizobium petrolearium]MBP1848423.1 3alpha(or 20beta)-hydroxysteroid dehydrogenase [Neorhizobium petrolearium]MCC2614482.1 SDR family oxidoreductase [Neorhizobium petrolearium]WGI72244.1 SDR family NAD(P)-dependent oxidoreductase [Neorhizobium petrolearium]